jgi:ribosomal protein S1
VSEQEDDFATMFEASVKVRRFEQGQLAEGTIVAFGAEVAFVSVGEKREAQIDLAELKDDAGEIEVSLRKATRGSKMPSAERTRSVRASAPACVATWLR